MVPYVVQQGQHLEQIAYRLGFDATTVWNAADNESLREQRPDPNILAAGDVLYVPDPKDRKWLSVTIGSVNRFRASRPRVKVQVKFAVDGMPCKNEAFTVVGDALPAGGTTGPDGLVSLSVPVTTCGISVILTSRNMRFPVHVGHLDPVATDSGVTQRLKHLGLMPSPQSSPDPGEARLRGIAQFQARQNLPITGTMDDATRAALVSAHGS